MINNTYYGSIYKNAFGIQTHKFKISNYYPNQGSYLTYSSRTDYDLIIYVDIPKYPFIFSAKGNYTDGTAGWGISEIQITSGYCSQYCLQCDVSFKCINCQSGYFIYQDGSCISYCSAPYQKLDGIQCYDYDNETPYSKYLIQEYINDATSPEYYGQYTLISQSGINFLKGSDIYYSYFGGITVFGGPFVWAQAKFQRIHNIQSPHHSVSIAFYILFGPSFPTDGRFIYNIENNPVESKLSTSSSHGSYSDGSKYIKVYEKIIHSANTLTITWECFGSNNEPVKAYCGFYNYYIVVHNCQPYCQSCLNYYSCDSWNYYDSTIISLSQTQCSNNQYYDKYLVRCLDCPASCQTCTSKIDCQTCKSTYTQPKLGCICTMKQYEDSNQCFNCPIECNQCLSPTYCIECLYSNNRQLINGKCDCIDGYYPIMSNPQCKQCHYLCKTCIGPSSDECLSCNNIGNIQQVGSTCSCPIGQAYQDKIKACSSCHSSCLACFRTTIDGCLTCEHTLNRILEGLRCICAPGFYESSNICTNCPNTEDSSLSQCYKQCNNNQQIWHTITCNSCDIGFQLVSGECQPICGDTQIKGYEQCEDNNTIFNDLCYNCQFQCPAHCITCNQFTVLPCPDTCGDEIISGIEECEDGNTIQYDGCYNCQYQCQPQCTKCIKGQCIECLTVCGDGMIVGSEQCEDFFSLPYKGCQNCKPRCQNSCFICDTTGLGCLSCKFGYNRINYTCYSVCGDKILTEEEQCDDGNLIIGDGCHFCQFSCQDSCLNCIQGDCYECQEGYEFEKFELRCNLIVSTLSFCQYQLKLFPDLYCSYCFEYCEICNENKCIICQNGYYLDINFSCISNYGDGIVVKNEECEKINVIIEYEYQECLFKCQRECLNCIDGVCFACEEIGWEIDIISRGCKPICGDGLVVGKEQCDDANEIDEDGCSQCQYLCQQQCTKCYLEFCLECNFQGWYLYENICITNCGDGIIVGDEQCDDQNTIQYDGCFDCKLECQPSCTDCRYGICYECGIQGWEIKNQFCLPICGDGVIIEDLEECDDGNIIPFDGCYECLYECQIGCLECQQNQCLKCFDDLYELDVKSSQCVQVNLNINNQDTNQINLDIIQYINLRCGEDKQLVDNKCVSLCGNGLVDGKNEECDDGNLNGGDGCSSFCHVEDSYQCVNQNGSFSLCTFILAPEFNLKILSDISNPIQIVELTFSQQVKALAELPLEEIMVFVITPQTKHELILRVFSNITINLSNPKYQVQIEFFESVSNPVLEVYTDKTMIFNSFEQSLDIIEKQINLGTPYVLPESTKQQLTSIVQLNDVMILALLTGSTIMFFNLLDLLQSLSYMKFMQYQFPPHLTIFLNTYTKVSLQPIFDYFETDQYLRKLKGESTSNQVNQNKDPQNTFNQHYLFNAKSCYFSIIASLLTYIIYCLLVSQRVERLFFKLSKKFRIKLIIQLVLLFQKQIQMKCLILKIEYFSLGIFKVYQAILHQFMFSVLVQFPNYKFDTPFEIFNSINAILGLLFIVIANIPLLSITSSKIKNLRKWKYFYHESKPHFWALQFRPFLIYRILFYILIIVKLIDYPEAQSILLSMQSFFFLIYLIKFKPQKCVFEMIKLMCREFLLIIITGSFLIYSFEFSQEYFLIFGWIHIGLFCIILVINLLLDVLQQILKTYDRYCQKKKKQRRKEMMKKFYLYQL
ncbi:unnamed protein product [Paramecium sonneborni]|uniref:EGF-like domain-containing protein n=1 Tax=Paramecium sonneborni TaxID=65129 RepID=A0A8S1PJX6_9CILI|nr:unnamed protein product [Paramecium sonneborni]